VKWSGAGGFDLLTFDRANVMSARKMKGAAPAAFFALYIARVGARVSVSAHARPLDKCDTNSRGHVELMLADGVRRDERAIDFRAINAHRREPRFAQQHDELVAAQTADVSEWSDARDQPGRDD